MRSLRILYVALDQTVPARSAGRCTQAVAEGLAAIGHDVHVAVQPGGRGRRARRSCTGTMPPLGRPQLRWLRHGAIRALARDMRADVIIERYYNFGGEGVLAARDLDVPAVLEVNAPIVDHPGSAKSRLDRALLVQPLRRWRDHVSRLTTLFVTPSAEILPAWVDRQRVLEIEWGADVDRFRPDAAGTPPLRRAGRTLCLRRRLSAWHGAVHLAAALARLQAARDDRFGGVFIGEGPNSRHAHGWAGCPP